MRIERRDGEAKELPDARSFPIYCVRQRGEFAIREGIRRGRLFHVRAHVEIDAAASLTERTENGAPSKEQIAHLFDIVIRFFLENDIFRFGFFE